MKTKKPFDTLINELVKAHCFFLLSGVDYFHCYITKFDLVCQETKSFYNFKKIVI